MSGVDCNFSGGSDVLVEPQNFVQRLVQRLKPMLFS